MAPEFNCFIFDVALLTTGFTKRVSERVLLNAKGVVILSSDCLKLSFDSVFYYYNVNLFFEIDLKFFKLPGETWPTI